MISVHFCGRLRELFVVLPVHFCGHLRVFVCYALSTIVDTCACSLVMFAHFCGHLRVFVCYALSTIVDTSASVQLTASDKVKNSLVKWYLTRVFLLAILNF